jgi:hypothetical protein
MIGILILAVLALVCGAFALRLGHALLERSADRAAAGEAARAEADARHRAHPDWLVTLQATLLRVRIHPLEQRRGQLMTERDAVKAAADAQPAGPSLVRKLLGYASLLLLPLLFLLSVYQLVPSFYTLSGNAPLSLFGGLLVAAIEVGVALALARVLYRGRGNQAPDDEVSGGQIVARSPDWAGQPGRRAAGSLAERLLAMTDSQPGWSKIVLTGAMTLAVAGVLVWGQYNWAPAHDLINLEGQLTVATDRYAQDQANGAPQSLLASDQQDIDTISTRLAAVRSRDEMLALVVPLGEDAVALPGLGALGFAAKDLRRLGRRRRMASLNRRIGALGMQIEQTRDAITLDLQRMLAGLGVDPALAVTPPQALPVPPATPAGRAHQVVPGQVVPPGQPVPPDPVPPDPACVGPAHGQATPPDTPGAQAPETRGPLTVDDLFPATHTQPGAQLGADADSADVHDARWTDPL